MIKLKMISKNLYEQQNVYLAGKHHVYKKLFC
jgi:hypothetical protein